MDWVTKALFNYSRGRNGLDELLCMGKEEFGVTFFLDSNGRYIGIEVG